jgi:nuclear pore complex protein Nup107
VTGFADSFNMIGGQEPEFYYPELLAFALRLEQSKILHMPQDLKEDQTPPSGYDLISRLQDFAAHHIGDMAHAVENLTNSSPGNARNAELDLMASELRYWEMEHQTWKLFGSLMMHRLGASENPKDVPLDIVNDRFTSNGRIRDHLYENDPIFRELVLVLRWLQDYAPEPTIDDLETDGMYRGDRGWMYTKEKLKSNKRLHPGKQLSLFGVSARTRFMPPTSTRNLVTELDPDAPVRQQRQLEAEDEGWERYLMKLIWAFLRRGDLTSAQELCEDAGELWRAVSLGGGDDAWDSRIDGGRDGEDGEEDDVVGNRRRELWRRMCFAIAHRRGGEDYEKAVYGILCGDVESVGGL